MIELETRVEGVFKSIFDQDDLSLRREMTAADVDGWDSLNHIRLIVALEKEFKIKFSAGDVVEMKNVGDLTDKIKTKVKVTP